MCSNLILEYFDDYVPCSFPLRDRFTGRYTPCQVRKKTHGNLHLGWKTGQRLEHKGEFENHFNPELYDWSARVLGEIEKLQELSPGQEWNGLRHGWVKAHRKCIKQFYKKLNVSANGSTSFNSHTICLCCLSNPPEHHLQCGHIICNPCAIDFSTNDDLTQITVDDCPVCDEGCGANKTVPTVIARPPLFSGQRILVLDGYERFSSRDEPW